MLVSDKGQSQVRLDTGTIATRDILDHDKSISVNAQLGLTLSEKAKDGTAPKTDAQGHPVGGSVSGAYAMHDIAQVTRATIGGTIAVRDQGQQRQDVKGINRGVTQAQVITKNVSAGTKVYVSDTAVKEIASGFAGIRSNLDKLGQAAADGFATFPQGIKSAVAEAARQLDLSGKTVDETAGALVDELVAKGEIKPEDKEKSKKAAIEVARAAAEDPKASAQLGSCGGKQGSLLHDLLFPPAYAEVVTLGAVGAACAAGPVVAAVALTAVVIGGIIYIASRS